MLSYAIKKPYMSNFRKLICKFPMFHLHVNYETYRYKFQWCTCTKFSSRSRPRPGWFRVWTSDPGSFNRFDIERSIGTEFCKIKFCAGKLKYFQLIKPKKVKTMRKMMHECDLQGIEDRCLQQLFGSSYFWS